MATLAVALEATTMATATLPATNTGDGPRVFLMDGPSMHRLRSAPRADDRLTPALDRLRRQAEDALEAGPFSVVFKTATPPSGDKHDYMSVGPYWWPNPETADGLPYVRRDGESNPARSTDAYDSTPVRRMSSSVLTLALAGYFTGDTRYARRAAHLLRTWFIEPETRMHPHLRYAQAIPGRTPGRGIGIIDTMSWVEMLDAVGLLEESGHWPPDDRQALRQWFAAYLDWLKTSANGLEEQRQANNHGTWYDAQVIAIALFTDQPERAREQIAAWTIDRLTAQFAADGSQPREILRTLSWHYSVMNLRGFFSIARLAEQVGVDLWRHATASGNPVRKGLDFLLPYALGDAEWPHPRIDEFRPDMLGNEILPLAIRTYGAEGYRSAAERLDVPGSGQQGTLMFPAFLAGQ